MAKLMTQSQKTRERLKGSNLGVCGVLKYI